MGVSGAQGPTADLPPKPRIAASQENTKMGNRSSKADGSEFVHLGCPVVPFYPFFQGFPYKIANPKKGALVIIWLLGYHLHKGCPVPLDEGNSLTN